MNTYIFTKEEFLKFQSAFKAKAKTGNISASDMILYNIIRGKDSGRGFTPITQANKLANGMMPWHAYSNAKYNLKWSLTPTKYNPERGKTLWGIEITEDQRAQIVALLP